eukprot:3080462-Rhodomonas_salina.1
MHFPCAVYRERGRLYLASRAGQCLMRYFKVPVRLCPPSWLACDAGSSYGEIKCNARRNCGLSYQECGFVHLISTAQSFARVLFAGEHATFKARSRDFQRSSLQHGMGLACDFQPKKNFQKRKHTDFQKRKEKKGSR